MLPTSLFAIFAFSFSMALAAVASPGPISTAIVSQTPRQGWKVGPLVATGHALMELGIILLISLGLSGLTHPGVQIAVAWIGGGLLLWMGGVTLWETLRGKVRLPRPEDGGRSLSGRQLVGLGALATLGNPFWYAWWVTVAAGYLASAKAAGAGAVAAFYVGHISADYAWDTLLSTVIGGGRRWMNDGLYRLLLAGCGLFFVYLGGVFLFQGFGMLGR
ncbi:MAG: LysE family transporter [Chloroflexota bacterium]